MNFQTTHLVSLGRAHTLPAAQNYASRHNVGQTEGLFSPYLFFTFLKHLTPTTKVLIGFFHFDITKVNILAFICTKFFFYFCKMQSI